MTTSREKQLKLASIGSNFAEGQPYDNMCPFCGHSSLILSFTVMKSPFYGVFVVCRHCGKGEHLTLGEKPAGFREELVLPEFQRMEDAAIKGTAVDRYQQPQSGKESELD
jgi:hypothetical protein